MISFQYESMTTTGQTRQGTIAAVNRAAAIRALLPILPQMELVDTGVRIPHLHVPGFRSLGVRYNSA